MTAKPNPPRPKKASGRNVKEAERNTVAVKLRLSPDDAEDLDELARLKRMTRAQLVASLVQRALGYETEPG